MATTMDLPPGFLVAELSMKEAKSNFTWSLTENTGVLRKNENDLMNKQVELERLDRAIRDSTIRACTVKNNIDILDRDIANMGEYEKMLEENVRVLRRQKIVVIAEEFKKTKEELSKARIR